MKPTRIFGCLIGEAGQPGDLQTAKGQAGACPFGWNPMVDISGYLPDLAGADAGAVLTVSVTEWDSP